MMHLRVGMDGTLALDRHPVGFPAHAPGAGSGGWIAQQRAVRARLQMEALGRRVLEAGEVFSPEVSEADRHPEVLRLDWHGSPPVQPRRMTIAEPVPGMAQPKFALTSHPFTCRQPPSL